MQEKTDNHPADLGELVQIADLLMDRGITDAAANLLAYVMAQAAVDSTTYDHAWTLFDELEATICPRVIFDARAFAETATARDVRALLEATRREHLP